MEDKEYLKEYRRRALITLTINFKSLVYESRLIRLEKIKSSNNITRSALNEHRVNRVRTETRYTHLARMAVKGVPYSAVEPNAKREPDWKRLENKIWKHLFTKYYDEKKIKDWIDAGKIKFSNDHKIKCPKQ